MKPIISTLLVIIALAAAGCSERPSVKTVSLQCGGQGGHWTSYSFTLDKPTDSDQEIFNDEAEIIFYFDRDDCAQGALFGQDDEEGYLFPVGHKTWNELSLSDEPQANTQSVMGLVPITKQEEGLAFWVRTRNGRYVLVRVKNVRPASFSDFASGSTASVDLEWAWGTNAEDK